MYEARSVNKICLFLSLPLSETVVILYCNYNKYDDTNVFTLWQVLRDANQEVPAAMLDFDLNIKRKEHKLYGSFGPRGDAGQPMKKATKIVFDNDE